MMKKEETKKRTIEVNGATKIESIHKIVGGLRLPDDHCTVCGLGGTDVILSF